MNDRTYPDGQKVGGFPRVAPLTNWEANHMSLQRHYEAQHLANDSRLAALRARIGPLHVVNGHMPLAAGEVAELRRPATLRYVLGVLVDLGATLGFLAFVAFLLSRAGA